MTKKDHKCEDCEKLHPNQIVVDWDFNTGYLVIQVQPFSINYRDVKEEKQNDPNRLGPKEKEARERMENIAQRILTSYNKGL